MDGRYARMISRVGLAFYRDYVQEVRDAVRGDTVTDLIRRVTEERSDIVTAEYRIQAIASAVRQGYDE